MADFGRWIRRVYAAGLTVVTLVSLSVSAQAQQACGEAYASCVKGCQFMRRLNPTLGPSCAQGCTDKRRACITEASAPSPSPSTNNGSRSSSDTAPSVEPQKLDEPEAAALTQPMSDSEVTQKVRTMVDAQQKFDAALFERVTNFPPCQGSPTDALRRGYRPEDCLFGRGELQAQGRADRVRLLQGYLVPMVQSLELDVSTLPSDAIERVRFVHHLRKKYRTVLDQQKVRRTDASNRLYPEDEPLRRIGGASEGLLARLEAQHKADPVVRRAFAVGQLNADEIHLNLPEKRSWNYDRLTVALAREASSSSGGQAVFLDRTQDLARSERELRDAGQSARWGEPSANEMGLAVLRAFTAMGLARGDLSAPYEARINIAHQSWVVRVAHVEKQSCAKRAQGYHCKLRLWMHGFVDSPLDTILTAQAGKYAKLFDIAGQTTPSLQKQNGEVITVLFVPTPAGWTASELDTAWTIPKELEMFWTVMGGGRGASSFNPQAMSDALDQAYEAGAQQRRDEAEVRKLNESYQRDLMDRKCGLNRLAC